jgi:maleamate amidohydrolase
MSNDQYASRGYGDCEIGFGSRPAVLVVDFQLANTDPRYPVGGAPMVVEALLETSKLLQVARQRKVPVISCYTAYASLDDTPRWKIAAMREIYRHGHPCTALDSRILHEGYDHVICKTGPSMFFQTPLLPYLVSHGIDTLLVTGCNTSGCIRATAVDGFQHGFRTSVIRECVGDISAGPHEANLADIGRRYCDVVSAASAVAFLESRP